MGWGHRLLSPRTPTAEKWGKEPGRAVWGSPPLEESPAEVQGVRFRVQGTLVLMDPGGSDICQLRYKGHGGQLKGLKKMRGDGQRFCRDWGSQQKLGE